jgi:TRAP-type mannitol/chloroaromatic compound transport system substrate-binding protein
MVKRRNFIVRATGAAVAARVIIDAPNVIAQPKVQWRMSTAWTASILYQRAAEQLAKVVEEVSGGRFRIEVFPATLAHSRLRRCDTAAGAA